MLLKDKLDFLLKISMTTNRQLATEMNIDPSFVSRIRSGARSMPANTEYAKGMAEFFAQHLESDYQRTALAETLGNPKLRDVDTAASLTQIIYDWLMQAPFYANSASRFLSEFDKFKLITPSRTSAEEAEKHAPPPTMNEGYVFYGNAGRRSAVRMLLRKAEEVEPSTLLMVSDENHEWLIEDATFSQYTTERLVEYARKGWQIKRIAPTFKTADIAFDSLARWLPLYMTGQAESHYYPRLRDDVYRRTLFVVPGVMALVSTSVGIKTESGLTFVTFSKSASLEFAKEFDDYLAKCRPMTHAYPFSDIERMLNCADSFDAIKAPCYRRIGGLPLAFTPDEIINDLYARNTEKHKYALAFQDSLARQQENMKLYRCVDVIRLAERKQVALGKVPVMLATLHGVTRYYTVREYIKHLEAIVYNLEHYENYIVYLDGQDDANGLYVKEGYCALLIKRSDPGVMFEITENNVVAACTELLGSLTMPDESYTTQKTYAIFTIRAAISELKELL